MRPSIFEDGCQFEFFQAVQVLERLYPDREPVGRTGPPSREIARFNAHLSIQFPASEIQVVNRESEGEDPQPTVTVNFMGMTGPLGVMPLRYTELLLERAAAKDHTLRLFLDLFNHRFVSLFYRAWEKYRMQVAYVREERDDFSQYLRNLIGMGTAGLRDRLAVRDRALLFYSGLVAQRPHSATALEGILRDYFGVPAGTVQFHGHWLRLEEDDQNRLGVRNCTLGQDLYCGGRIWDRQSKFRVCLGPLGIAAFRRFLPPGDAYRSLVHWVRFFAGLEYDFDFQLTVKAKEVPGLRLVSRGDEGAYLGWSAWLKTRPFKMDAGDTVVSERYESWARLNRPPAEEGGATPDPELEAMPA